MIRIIILFCSLLATFQSAFAIVLDPTLPSLVLQTGTVRYNGSSGVAIDPYWVLTAKHCGYSPGISKVLMDGIEYSIVEYRASSNDLDIALVRVDRPLPRWNRLSDRAPTNNEIVVLGGWGLGSGSALPNNTGFNIQGGSWSLRHGKNRSQLLTPCPYTEGCEIYLRVDFSAPSTSIAANGAVAFEAIPALNDSGGPMFIQQPDGGLRVAGFVRTGPASVAQYGWASAEYRNVNASVYRSFINSVDPSLFRAYCPADFNGNGVLSIDDLFLFLSAWFALDARADVNGIPGITIDDLFSFLVIWFQGC